MSNGRFEKKKKKKNGYVWLIAVLVIALIGLLVLALYLNSERSQQDAGSTNGTTGGTVSEDPGQEETSAQTLQNSTQGSEPAVQSTTEGDTSQQTTNLPQIETQPPVAQTQPPAVETQPPVIETQAPVEIVEQAKADYERWLASAMLMGISLEYPDFEITGIYLASATTMENMMDSKGCYILFNSAGQQMALHGVPLNAERTEAGTRDISSQIIGFATFDLVSPDAVNTASLVKIEMADLSDLIAQSMLVSIFSR